MGRNSERYIPIDIVGVHCLAQQSMGVPNAIVRRTHTCTSKSTCVCAKNEAKFRTCRDVTGDLVRPQIRKENNDSYDYNVIHLGKILIRNQLRYYSILTCDPVLFLD